MGNPQDLLRLADEVAAATGPDRELDRAIKEAVGHAWDYAADWGPRGNDRPVAFAYTASLDAAMTLVPENKELLLQVVFDTAEARIIWLDADIQVEAEAKTLALAITAAALRARAHSTKESENG